MGSRLHNSTTQFDYTSRVSKNIYSKIYIFGNYATQKHSNKRLRLRTTMPNKHLLKNLHLRQLCHTKTLQQTATSSDNDAKQTSTQKSTSSATMPHKNTPTNGYVFG